MGATQADVIKEGTAELLRSIATWLELADNCTLVLRQRYDDYDVEEARQWRDRAKLIRCHIVIADRAVKEWQREL